MSNCNINAANATESLDINRAIHGRLIRLPEVMERVGLKRSAIYRRMKDGNFPRSRSIGPKCTVWVEAEIEDWIREIIRT